MKSLCAENSFIYSWYLTAKTHQSERSSLSFKASFPHIAPHSVCSESDKVTVILWNYFVGCVLPQCSLSLLCWVDLLFKRPTCLEVLLVEVSLWKRASQTVTINPRPCIMWLCEFTHTVLIVSLAETMLSVDNEWRAKKYFLFHGALKGSVEFKGLLLPSLTFPCIICLIRSPCAQLPAAPERVFLSSQFKRADISARSPRSLWKSSRDPSHRRR